MFNFFKRLFQKSEPPTQATSPSTSPPVAPPSLEASPRLAATAGVAPPIALAPSALDQLAQRVRHAAESVLENESLTEGLNDIVAGELVKWGVACAETAARDTAGLGEAEAEEALYPRMRATRKLMRSVRVWITGSQTAGADPARLDEIVEQAAVIYGQNFVAPSAERLDAFLEQQKAAGLDPQRMVAGLRELLTTGRNT